MRPPNWLRIKCQHAHELMSARMDHAPLSTGDRFKLWLHLRFCEFCARIEKQMSFLSEAVKRIDR